MAVQYTGFPGAPAATPSAISGSPISHFFLTSLTSCHDEGMRGLDVLPSNIASESVLRAWRTRVSNEGEQVISFAKDDGVSCRHADLTRLRTGSLGALTNCHGNADIA